MSDSVQPIQRNLYQTGVTGTYRDGTGVVYSDQLQRLSWPISADLPTQAQRSARMGVESGRYSTLHPMQFYQTREIDEPTFTETYGKFGILDSESKLPAHERLFNPSKSLFKPGLRHPSSQAEMAGDEAFSRGHFEDAVRQYTLGLAQKPSLSAYEKRCACYAHIGRYTEALADAEFILKNGAGGGELPSARLRVKAIKDFLKQKYDTSPGHEHATATLMCALTPREHRQWRSTTPSPYTRPYPFGGSATARFA